MRDPRFVAHGLPTLTSAQITRLAHLLDGPVGSELRRSLDELRLPLGSESTKWRMLRESFQLAQRRDGPGGSVLRFVKQALDPAHELGFDGRAAPDSAESGSTNSYDVRDAPVEPLAARRTGVGRA